MQHYLLIKTYPQWHCAHNPLFYCWPNLQVLLRLPRRSSRRWMVPPRPMYVYVLYLLYVGLIYQSESHVYEQKGIGPGYWIYVYVQLYTSMILYMNNNVFLYLI